MSTMASIAMLLIALLLVGGFTAIIVALIALTFKYAFFIIPFWCIRGLIWSKPPAWMERKSAKKKEES